MLEKKSTQKSTQKRHARFHEAGMVYHIISKVNDGSFLLTPKRGIRELCAGVVAKGLFNNTSIKLYAHAFLSNHIHMMLSASSSLEIATFVGYVKREISRRVGSRLNKKGPKWLARYTSTALPTAQSQEESLKYILSQGVKEDLVNHPCDWPGLHCAKSLSTGENVDAQWFNATAYKLKKRQQQTLKKPKKVKKSDFYESFPLKLTVLPHWEELPKAEQQGRVKKMIADRVATGARERRAKGIKLVGVKKVTQASVKVRVAPPKPPWWQERRRQIVAWASPREPETRAYLKLYHAFQDAFREASENRKKGFKAVFPPGAWVPMGHVVPASSA